MYKKRDWAIRIETINNKYIINRYTHNEFRDSVRLE